MPYDIVIGRGEDRRKRLGTEGTILLGKQYVKMERTTSLSNKVFLDVSTSHVVFVCGKRGSGKSYTLGVIAEGLLDLPEELASKVSVIILDTMGVFWTMKYPNNRDTALLQQWGIEPTGVDVVIYTPHGYFKEFQDKGIPTDKPFSIRAHELDAYQWCEVFDIPINDPMGVMIERILAEFDEDDEYDLPDIVKKVKSLKGATPAVRNAVENRFIAADTWGLFSEEGTPLDDLINPGNVIILDLSCYATMSASDRLRALVIGLLSQRMFVDRMVARKNEEYNDVKSGTSIFEAPKQSETPMVWLVIDEAHEFLPDKGKTLASEPLIRILREGRQPGISLILASQQPGKIHTDVMTQSDTVISHRITARIDIDALGTLMQSYMREGLDKYVNELPKVDGAAIVFDDMNERIYPIRVRPRKSWHGGSSPTILSEKEHKSLF